MQEVQVELQETVLSIGIVERGEAAARLVPPSRSLFDQVIAHLDAKAPHRAQRPSAAQESRAAVGVCLRWGTYLALLMDEARPSAPSVTRPGMSRVTDREMKRMNIEASANLAEWLTFAHEQRDRYARLVQSAQSLPMPPLPRRRPPDTLRLAAGPRLLEVTPQLAHFAPGEAEDARRRPVRSLANSFVHTHWRNAGIEDFHAGDADRVRLRERRFLPDEATGLIQDTMVRFIDAVGAFRQIEPDWGTPRFAEYALGFRLLPFLGASGWTTTDTTCVIDLYDDEVEDVS